MKRIEYSTTNKIRANPVENKSYMMAPIAHISEAQLFVFPSNNSGA